MTVENQEVEQSEAEALAAMESGFNGSDATPEQIATDANAAAVEVEDVPAVVVTEAELREALSQQLEDFKAETKSKLDKAFGKFGAIQDSLSQVQQARQGDVFTPDKLKRVSEEFPELAALLAEDLTGILGSQQSVNGKVSAFDEEAFKAKVREENANQLSDYERKLEIRALTRNHKDWQDVISFDQAEDGSIKWVNSEFGKFVSGLPKETQDEITSSSDADFLSGHIDAFKSARQSVADASIANAKRLEKAVIQRGVPGTAQQKTALDEMEAGFRAAM